MTAVVGILNKQAVAIAADSAVTVDGNGGHKIFNKANKLFTLSKEHPVGVMIYNAASFMGTPWETVIKIYRRELVGKSFPTIKEYEEDFIRFLHSKNFYTTEDMQAKTLENFASNIIRSIINEIAQTHPDLINNPTPDNGKQLVTYFERKVDSLIELWGANNDYCVEFIDYSFEMFDSYSGEIFEQINQNHFINNEIHITDELLMKLKRVVYSILIVKEDISIYTGLIFTGFGEEEIYPQLCPVNISMVIDNRLRYYVHEGRIAAISNENDGAICPFAQTDVIDTILTGIDPNLENIYLNNFKALFEKYNKMILDQIGETNPILYGQIENLNIKEIVDEFNKLNQDIKLSNNIVPLMSAVSNLAKEDLAEMAESLIYLTYLKRRITFAEESVGGPVDVAIISKGDGFVWIKRKHYFKPELNQHFFGNYFKK